MAADGRNAEEIRRQLSSERDELVQAISDLREDVHDARRIPMMIGAAVTVGLGAFAVVKIIRGRGD